MVAPSPRGERRGFQIGPRIRIGGALGHIGQEAKIGLGKVDKAAAPFVAMIPGVGQIAAPIMNIAGNALDTSNGGGIKTLGDAGRVGLQSAGMYGLGKLGSALGKIPGVAQAGDALSHIPGVGAVTDAAHSVGSALSSIPGMSQIGDAAKQAFGGAGGIGDALGTLGKDAMGFLTGNGGMNALGAAGAVNAAMLQQKSNEYAKNALGSVQESYDQRAPLRTGGMQAMQSALGANPFSGTAMPQRQAGAMATTPAQRPVTLGGY